MIRPGDKQLFSIKLTYKENNNDIGHLSKRKEVKNMIRKWYIENRLKILVMIIVLLVMSIAIIRINHDNEVRRVKGELSDANNRIPLVSVIPEQKSLTSESISSSGHINSNQSNKFMEQIVKKENNIEKGKEKPLYTYTFNYSPNDTIRAIKQEIKEEKAPKEVQKADFVTVEKDETTVKVNAYYNYQPSIYYVPEMYPKPFKRHDIIYTNRDTLVSINYDGRRDGEFKDKLGVGIGKRIASW